MFKVKNKLTLKEMRSSTGRASGFHAKGEMKYIRTIDNINVVHLL